LTTKFFLSIARCFHFNDFALLPFFELVVLIALDAIAPAALASLTSHRHLWPYPKPSLPKLGLHHTFLSNMSIALITTSTQHPSIKIVMLTCINIESYKIAFASHFSH